MRLFFAGLIVVLLFVSAGFGICGQTIVLDEFEDSAQWGFTNGGEFPGASGGIDCIGGRLTLHYDFTKGGGYVGALYQGTVLLQTSSFTATITSDANCQLNYRLTDANGRVFQGNSQNLKAGEKQDIVFPINNNWQSSWGGTKGDSPQPVGTITTLWICVCTTPDTPKTGNLYISNFRSDVSTQEQVQVTGPARANIPFIKAKSVKSPSTVCYYPQDEKLDDCRVFMGYNEPGESANDARDLRITSKDGKYLFALWGRLKVTGDQEYVTPTDMSIRTRHTINNSIWEWDNTDARLGFQQVVNTSVDSKGVTSTIYLRFLKSHKGNILIPYVVPTGPMQFYAGGEKSSPYTKILTPKRATRVEFAVGDKKLYILNSIANPNGVTITYGQKLWMHFFRAELPISYVNIKPPDGKTFPKGYANAVQLRITFDSTEKLPQSIEKPNWNDGVGIYVMEKDDSGKQVVPRVNRPHIFFQGEKKQLSVALYNLSMNQARNIALDYTLKDYSNKTVLKKSRVVSLSANAVSSVNLDFPITTKGIFSLTLTARQGKNVYATKTCRLSVVPKPAEVAVKDSFFGIDPLFLEGSQSNMDMLRRLGIRWLRLGGGVWYPAEGDKAHLKTLKQNGIGYFLLIENADMVRGPEYNDLIDYYEISNEPDGWSNPEAYAQFAKPIYERAKQVNPDVTVLACSVSGGDSDSDFAFTKRFLAAGGAGMCQGIPYHPYSSIRAFGPNLQAVSPEENRLYDKMLQGRQLCKDAGLRTWIGEVGFLTINSYRYPSPDFHIYEKSYANYMARFFLISKCIPELERVVWFHLCMDDTPLTLFASNYGTYDSMGPNNNITPCLTAYANLASLIDGSKFIKKLQMAYPALWGVQTRKGDRNVLALWSPNDPCTLTFNYTGSLNAVSLVGTESVLKPVKGKIVLNISDEPRYLVFTDSQASLVDKIESAVVTFKEPISIGSLGVMPGNKLSVSLKNKYARPISASVKLVTSAGQEIWPVTLDANEDKAIILSCQKSGMLTAVKSIQLIVTAEGQSSVKTKTFAVTEVKPDLIAVKTTKPVTIDGDLRDWDNVIPIVSDKHEQVTPPDPGFWDGPEDLSFSAQIMYDDSYLYFACKVTDDTHKNDEIPGKIWAGDSIQLGLANQDTPFNYTEINLGLSTVAGTVGYETLGPDAGKPLEGLKFATKGGNGELTYETAIPLASLKGIPIGSGSMIHCAFIVNDIDDTARKWIGIKDPSLIGGNKDAKYFPILYFKP